MAPPRVDSGRWDVLERHSFDQLCRGEASIHTGGQRNSGFAGGKSDRKIWGQPKLQDLERGGELDQRWPVQLGLLKAKPHPPSRTRIRHGTRHWAGEIPSESAPDGKKRKPDRVPPSAIRGRRVPSRSPGCGREGSNASDFVAKNGNRSAGNACPLRHHVENHLAPPRRAEEPASSNPHQKPATTPVRKLGGIQMQPAKGTGSQRNPFEGRAPEGA